MESVVLLLVGSTARNDVPEERFVSVFGCKVKELVCKVVVFKVKQVLIEGHLLELLNKLQLVLVLYFFAHALHEESEFPLLRGDFLKSVYVDVLDQFLVTLRRLRQHINYFFDQN